MKLCCQDNTSLLQVILLAFLHFVITQSCLYWEPGSTPPLVCMHHINTYWSGKWHDQNHFVFPSHLRLRNSWNTVRSGAEQTIWHYVYPVLSFFLFSTRPCLYNLLNRNQVQRIWCTLNRTKTILILHTTHRTVQRSPNYPKVTDFKSSNFFGAVVCYIIVTYL